MGVAAGAMLLCNFHRSTFSALLPELGAQLHLRPGQLGEVQAAMLAAYLAGQLPAGLLADRFGGPRVLLVGLALWSAATALTAAAAAPLCLDGGGSCAGGSGAAPALAALYASRLLLGLSSACAMPCVTATAVEYVPTAARAGAVSTVYALFNIGEHATGYRCHAIAFASSRRACYVRA